ncbi:hypothetical protein [Rhizobium sp.]|uniref:hypothetical protein n=1 Tax=Rhizobium sp. TaxID=391 RepID=UPI003F820B1D
MLGVATNLSRGVSNSKGGTMFILFARPFPVLPFSLHFREIRFKNGAHQDMRVDQPPMADLMSMPGEISPKVPK